MLLRRLLSSCFDQDSEEEAALCGEERRQCDSRPRPLSRRSPLQLAERPTPQLPLPPLSTLGCTVPPSPSKLPLAAGSLSPRAIQAPSSLADALLWLDGTLAGPAASPAAHSAAGSPAAAPLAPAEQVRSAFAAGQRRRRVLPAQRELERRRLREEQADHRRTVEELERDVGHSLDAEFPPQSGSLNQLQEAQCTSGRGRDGQRRADHHPRQHQQQLGSPPTGLAGPPAAASPGFSLAPVFQTSTEAGPQVAPLHSQRAPQVQPQQGRGLSATSELAGARPGTLPGSSTAPAGAAAAWSQPSVPASAGHGGSSCSMRAQPGSSCRGGSPARPESPVFEIEVADLESGWTSTPAGAGCAPPGVWQLPATRKGRSPADQEEVLVGAARTPSFEAIIQGVHQCISAGTDEGGSDGDCGSTAASRAMPRRAAAASSVASAACTPSEASGTARAEGDAAAPGLAACSSSDALLVAEETGNSSSAASDSLIPAVHHGQQGAGNRRLSPRPLLAQLAQALHALPQRPVALAGTRKPRHQKQPAAEDVRPRLHVAPAVQAAAVRRGRLAAGHSADENSPL